MDLKDLLELKEPTIEQYGEMEGKLRAIAREADEEIARLDAEDRARGADRLVGKDDGGEERAKAKDVAVRRRDDAYGVLSQVMAGAANLQARLEKEADQLAWSKVSAHLDNRIEAMKSIENLCDQIGELYQAVIAEGSAAMKAAPVKPDYRENGFNHLPGRLSAQIGTAVMARLHQSIDHLFSRMAVTPDYFAEVYERNVRINGLANFLAPIHKAILLQDA